jgi:2-dehydro-3-deoxygalactonokinase
MMISLDGKLRAHERLRSEIVRVGVDWGTSNLRAFRFAPDGAVLERRRSGDGVANVAEGAFERTLRALIEDWLQPSARVVISGMAGAREGLTESPYLPCPANVADLAAGLVVAPSDTFSARIAPGLMVERSDRAPDIMRGEETQIWGALDHRGADFVIAPGTHSKWARIDGARIVDIRTFLTGDLFTLLRRHSFLARLIEGDAAHAEAFASGVNRALNAPGVLGLLFSVRAEGLFGRMAPDALSAYLSGLLIGSEIAEGLAQFPTAREGEVLIVGAAKNVELYGEALHIAGMRAAHAIDGEEAAARGLWRMFEASS